MMKALYLSMRLAGTDGVSLETEKLASALASFGIERVDCAGEVSTQGAYLIPEMHFTDPVALELGQRAFSGTESDPELEAALFERAAFLRERIAEVVAEVRPDLLVMQNVWAVPMQLPLARALADIAAESALPCLSHEHDYYWERERFKQTRIPEYLDRYFPFHAPNIRHLCINSPAQRDLRQHRGLEATLLPNVFDFANPAPGIDAYNRDFREAIGLSDNQHLILQPTRVIPRKGIELAIDLLAELSDPDNVLVITHHAGDEGLDYLHRLERHAEERRVDLRYVADKVHHVRGTKNGNKIYALWDTYLHADFVTYPSLYEGFGNALLETIYFRKPALVNRYRVYQADLAPKGFDFIEIEGKVTPEAVAATQSLLEDPARQKLMTDHNYQVALKHYSLEALTGILRSELAALRVMSDE